MATLAASLPATLPPGLSLGMNSAEADDEYLLPCFIKTPAYEELTNFESSRMIALGRTGAGKTAILHGIQNNFAKIAEIDPVDISMEYISNSTILAYLSKVGADVDLLFQVIWKHVLCVEYIRLRYNVQDQKRWQSCLQRLETIVSKDERRTQALNYLKQYDGKFWITVDENLKEVVERITKKLETELGFKYGLASGGGKNGEDLTLEEKKEVVTRFRRLVTAEQLTLLSNLIGLLSEDEDKNGAKHFILIDKLDEHWIDDQIRFRMIRALIETLRRFRKIRRLKIVVALRTDVLERVLQETKESGFQREKHDDYAVELRWTPVLLMQMVSERLDFLARKKLGGVKVTFQELFPRKIGSQTLANYIVDRTLHRPRDFIAYINLCLKAAEGRRDISAAIVREVERDYSAGRYTALIDEWSGAFPCLSITMHYLAKFEHGVSIKELAEAEEFDDLVEDILIQDRNRRDPLYPLAEAYLASAKGIELSLVRQAVQILYRIGAIGVRRHADDKVRYSHVDMPTLSETELTDAASVRLHNMFVPALKGNAWSPEAE